MGKQRSYLLHKLIYNMIPNETLKQFENINFDVVKEYLPTEKEIIKLIKKHGIIESSKILPNNQ